MLLRRGCRGLLRRRRVERWMSSRDLVAESYAALEKVLDPVLGVDVVSSGLATVDVDALKVSCDLDVGSAAHPGARVMAEGCSEALAKIKGFESVNVSATASGFGLSASSSFRGLRDVRAVVAVSSAKGGVGKSTVAANLARALSAKGGRVGLADLDVEGPSLPTLFGCPHERLRPSPRSRGTGDDFLAMPVEKEGLKLASVGFIDAPKDLAALRGPLAGRVASQVLTRTDWGSLDYLVLDFPPGIGDVAITIARDATIHANVVCSTPSLVSRADVKRGLPLFKQFHIPNIAFVDNMAYFKCPNCEEKHRIFGGVEEPSSSEKKNDAESKNDAVFELPLSLSVRDANEQRSLTGSFESLDLESREAYLSLASHVIDRLLRDGFRSRQKTIDVSFDKKNLRILLRTFDDQGAVSLSAPLASLRPGIPDTVLPTRLRVVAKRAVHVDWSDGRRNDVYALDRFS